jgi:transcriptional regulator with XRE-family HTH domain
MCDRIAAPIGNNHKVAGRAGEHQVTSTSRKRVRAKAPAKRTTAKPQVRAAKRTTAKPQVHGTSAAKPNVAALLAEIERLETQTAAIPTLQKAIERLAVLLGPNPEGSSPDDEARPQGKQHWPVFLKEWRRSRNATLEKLEPATGLSMSQLSRVENGLQSYTQEILEGYAEALGCRPADLLSHPPHRPENALNPLFTQLRAQQVTRRTDVALRSADQQQPLLEPQRAQTRDRNR